MKGGRKRNWVRHLRPLTGSECGSITLCSRPCDPLSNTCVYRGAFIWRCVTSWRFQLKRVAASHRVALCSSVSPFAKVDVREEPGFIAAAESITVEMAQTCRSASSGAIASPH